MPSSRRPSPSSTRTAMVRFLCRGGDWVGDGQERRRVGAGMGDVKRQHFWWPFSVGRARGIYVGISTEHRGYVPSRLLARIQRTVLGIFTPMNDRTTWRLPRPTRCSSRLLVETKNGAVQARIFCADKPLSLDGHGR